MNKGLLQIPLSLAATLIITVTAHAADQPEGPTTSDEFFDKYIKDHLQIGIRSSLRILTDDDSGHWGGVYGSGTYLGTIYALDENQNAVPILLNATYFFNKYIGIEIAYDQITATTAALDSSTLEEKTDGDITISGPTITLLAQYRNSTNFTPYAGVGLGFYSATFDADPEWTLASEYNGAAYNHMEVDSVIGLHLTAGMKWLFSRNWALDLSAQYVQADVDATYTGYYNDVLYTTQTGHFPMDNVAFRLGVAYHF